MAPRRPVAPPNACRRFPPQPVSREEFERLLAACGGSSTRDRRDAATLALLWHSGCRAAEVAALRWRDLEQTPEGNVLHVRDGKGHVPRSIAIVQPGELLDVLGPWRATSPRTAPEDPILCTRSGQPLATTALRRTVRRLAARAGVHGSRGVHCHGFRHSAARRWAAAGFSLPWIAGQLGHRRLTTSDSYLSALDASERLRIAAELAERQGRAA